jgi:hypothetical protein
MKFGNKVFVCHDGKWSRRVVGTVVRQHNGHHITVTFDFDGKTQTGKFVKKNPIRYQKRDGCITFMKRPKRYEGWLDIDYFCPWFAVYPFKKSQLSTTI